MAVAGVLYAYDAIKNIVYYKLNYGFALGISVVLGTNVEWSFAWPGSGMDADWSVLLTSDFSPEVVVAASLVGPAGAVPTGLTGVVEFTVSETVGLFGVDKSSFLQPTSIADISIADRSIADISVALGWVFDFFMLDSR